MYDQFLHENEVLKKIVARLEADSRIAEVLVTDVQFNPLTQKQRTTIKFLEYDAQGRHLVPKYFIFEGNIIQFQSLVVRFDDVLVRNADALKGRSVYLFLKAFFLNGVNTQEYEITPVNTVPEGYRLNVVPDPYEEKFWREFWRLALDGQYAKKHGIKNAQIEAPGTKFIPGMLYTLKIEHDGGIRIDATALPEILKGEKILSP